MIYPANILDLTSWKLTLPTGVAPAPGQTFGTPTEIKQPQLATYQDTNFARVGTGVRFRAGVNGINQNGSKYPRCELREMTPDGKGLASWSPATGRHTLTITQQINRLPFKKQEVVAGQIHDAAGFNLLVFVRGNGDGTAQVIARGQGFADLVMTPSYAICSLLIVHVQASDSAITCELPDVPGSATFGMESTATGMYFKAGVYTQSNLTIAGEDPASYGEVLIRSLAVTHTP